MLHSPATKYLQLQKTPKPHTVRQQECDHPKGKRLQALVFSVTRPTFAYNKTTLIGWHCVGYFLHAPRCSNTPVPTATTSSSGNSQASKAISFLGRQKICISVFSLAPMHVKTKIKQGKLDCIIINGIELRYSWTSVSHSRFWSTLKQHRLQLPSWLRKIFIFFKCMPLHLLK